MTTIDEHLESSEESVIRPSLEIIHYVERGIDYISLGSVMVGVGMYLKALYSTFNPVPGTESEVFGLALGGFLMGVSGLAVETTNAIVKYNKRRDYFSGME